MKSVDVTFQGIKCKLEHITKGSYWYDGKERYELWTNIKYSKVSELESNGFVDFDRGLYYKVIDENTAKELLKNK